MLYENLVAKVKEFRLAGWAEQQISQAVQDYLKVVFEEVLGKEIVSEVARYRPIAYQINVLGITEGGLAQITGINVLVRMERVIEKTVYSPALSVVNEIMKQLGIKSNGVWALSFITVPIAPISSGVFGFGWVAGLLNSLSATTLKWLYYGLTVTEMILWNMAFRGGFVGAINAYYYDRVTDGQSANPYLWADYQDIFSA